MTWQQSYLLAAEVISETVNKPRQDAVSQKPNVALVVALHCTALHCKCVYSRKRLISYAGSRGGRDDQSEIMFSHQ